MTEGSLPWLDCWLPLPALLGGLYLLLLSPANYYAGTALPVRTVKGGAVTFGADSGAQPAGGSSGGIMTPAQPENHRHEG